MGDFDWNEQAMEKLRTLWSQGMSTKAIGSAMGISKNAILGKAHRLNLPPRPSPIRRGEGVPEAKPRVQRLPKTAPAFSAIHETHAPIVRVEAVFVGPVKPCCWPIGEPRSPSFHFCGIGSVPGKPYCTRHDAIAHGRALEQREAAA